MTPEQVKTIGRMVATICPAQKFNTETPDAWAALLGWVNFDDARAALYVLGQTHQFISPADIIAEVRRIRAERLKGFVPPAPPPETTDDPAQYKAVLKAAIAQAAAPRRDRPEITTGLGEVAAARARALRASGGRFVDVRHDKPTPRHSSQVQALLAQARQKCAQATASRNTNEPEPAPPPPKTAPAVDARGLAPLATNLEAIVRKETGQCGASGRISSKPKAPNTPGPA